MRFVRYLLLYSFDGRELSPSPRKAAVVISPALSYLCIQDKFGVTMEVALCREHFLERAFCSDWFSA